jgi:hypothetical protein
VLEHDPEDDMQLMEMAYDRDLPLPRHLREAPEVAPGLEIYWLAFWDLLSERSGMGDGPIRWTAIQAWADYNGLDEDQREALHHHLKRMVSFLLKRGQKNAQPGTVQPEDQ